MKLNPFKGIKTFLKELFTFTVFLKTYLQQRLWQAFHRFETAKDFLVGGLVAKRGKYVRPFLHTSMTGLFLIGLMVAPIIKARLPKSGYEEARAPEVLALATLEEATTTKISAKPRSSIVTYTVRPGDTISSIALKFGISEETVMWQNDLKKDTVIKPGAKLEILPTSGTAHKVKRGESIYSIAKKYTVEAQNIVNWPFNSFSNDETFELAVGQLLIIPEGIKPKASPPPQYLARKRTTPSAGAVSATGQFVWPAAGQLTQYFVWYHPAIDIANRSAPDILAADSGTVVSVISQRYSYGNHILIDHGNGFATLYAHLSSFYVSQGQTVNRGDLIGRMGCTGRCSGTHLHFEIRYNGVAQNPLTHLK